MGEQFLTENQPTQSKTYTEIFEEQYPFYLAIGMPLAEYWTGDSSLVRYYRKAYLIKQEQLNQQMWLQGMYFYDAISTALYNALRGKNSRNREYAKQPYELNNREKTEQEIQREVAIEQEKAMLWMESLVKRNKRA